MFLFYQVLHLQCTVRTYLILVIWRITLYIVFLNFIYLCLDIRNLLRSMHLDCSTPELLLVTDFCELFRSLDIGSAACVTVSAVLSHYY